MILKIKQHKIDAAYKRFYKEQGIYEIDINSKPLGFSVIKDIRGKNVQT